MWEWKLIDDVDVKEEDEIWVGRDKNGVCRFSTFLLWFYWKVTRSRKKEEALALLHLLSMKVRGNWGIPTIPYELTEQDDSGAFPNDSKSRIKSITFLYVPANTPTRVDNKSKGRSLAIHWTLTPKSAVGSDTYHVKNRRLNVQCVIMTRVSFRVCDVSNSSHLWLFINLLVLFSMIEILRYIWTNR